MVGPSYVRSPRTVVSEFISKIYIFGAMWRAIVPMIALASFQQGFKFRHAALSCMYIYIGYYSIDDAHRCEIDQGGPVFKKITRARPLYRRDYLSLLPIVAAHYFPTRGKFNAKRNQCEDVNYCTSCNAIFFVIIASRTTEGEMERQEEYRDVLWRTVIVVVLLGPRLDRTKRGSVSFKVFGIPFASRLTMPGPLPLLASLFYRFIPENHFASSSTSGRSIIRSHGR